MHVWIVQTGEPLPCDEGVSRGMRAMNAAKYLVDAGHRVTLWSSDFFHQEKVPVSRAYYNEFRDRLVAGHPAPENEASRIDRLMPVYGVKWLIMRLNEFRPDGAYRRAFADPQENPEERKVSQLEKAHTALEALKAELEETRIL